MDRSLMALNMHGPDDNGRTHPDCEDCRASVRELQAENERLREKLARWEAIDLGRIDAVTDRDADIGRLRAALEKLFDYTTEVENAMSVWVISRPYMAAYPLTEEERTAIGSEVRTLLGRDKCR